MQKTARQFFTLEEDIRASKHAHTYLFACEADVDNFSHVIMPSDNITENNTTRYALNIQSETCSMRAWSLGVWWSALGAQPMRHNIYQTRSARQVYASQSQTGAHTIVSLIHECLTHEELTSACSAAAQPLGLSLVSA